MRQIRAHLVCHSEINSPRGVLYGRLPGYGLTDRGRRIAHRIAQHFANEDVVHLVASPLQRAQETVAPPAHTLHSEPAGDLLAGAEALT